MEMPAEIGLNGVAAPNFEALEKTLHGALDDLGFGVAIFRTGHGLWRANRLARECLGIAPATSDSLVVPLCRPPE